MDVGFALQFANGAVGTRGEITIPNSILYPYGVKYELIDDSEHPERTYHWYILEVGFMAVMTDNGTFGGLSSGLQYSKNDILFVTQYNLVSMINPLDNETIASQSIHPSTMFRLSTYIADLDNISGGAMGAIVGYEPNLISITGWMVLKP
jgi:hypothetical protein